MPHDPADTPNADFPRLTPQNHRVIGEATNDYNCIAWACHDTSRWWQPGPVSYWPVPATPADSGVGDLIAMFTSLGFVECESADLELGFEKVAVYGLSQLLYTHAAILLPTGKWTSKLGAWELIEHDTPEDVAGGVYGDLYQFMKRPLTA